MNKRILIVDDMEGFREVFTYVFKWQLPDCQLELAADGFEALEAFRQQPFDLVLTDYDMPGLNGLELIHTLRRGWPETRFVLMSGSGELPYDGQAVDQVKIDGYLTKPFKLTKLMTMIEPLVIKGAAQ